VSWPDLSKKRKAARSALAKGERICASVAAPSAKSLSIGPSDALILVAAHRYEDGHPTLTACGYASPSDEKIRRISLIHSNSWPRWPLHRQVLRPSSRPSAWTTMFSPHPGLAQTHKTLSSGHKSTKKPPDAAAPAAHSTPH